MPTGKYGAGVSEVDLLESMREGASLPPRNLAEVPFRTNRVLLGGIIFPKPPPLSIVDCELKRRATTPDTPAGIGPYVRTKTSTCPALREHALRRCFIYRRLLSPLVPA